MGTGNEDCVWIRLNCKDYDGSESAKPSERVIITIALIEQCERKNPQVPRCG
jgi:hypothetical protein